MMDSMIGLEREIKSLTKKINDTKNQLAENKGQIKVLMEQLKSSYGFNSIEEAKAEIETMVQEINRMKQQIGDKFETLKERMASHD